MTHCLKTWPVYFAPIVEGIKTFDSRKNDRNFKVGDPLLLQEYDPKIEAYTGNEWRGEIVYILDNPDFVKKGFVILGIKEKENF